MALTQGPLSFTADIRPMFSDMDVDHMMKAMNLANRDSVFEHAEAIYKAGNRGSNAAGVLR
jgi:hypothetical protein